MRGFYRDSSRTSADINEMTAPMAATRAPKKTPGPKSVDPTWAIVWPMIEIERPKTAMETPAIVSAIPRNGFTEDPCRDFSIIVEDCLYDFQNRNLPPFSPQDNRLLQNVHETRIA